VPLSVLDIAPVRVDSDTTEALRLTVEAARHADALGFTRFWVAEHHGMTGIASSAPAVLIGAIAGATSRIRAGSGGVMLPNHAPIVIAEQFGTLGALYPGRIDLGLGRAPGTDPRTTTAVRRNRAPEGPNDFPEQLGELAAFLAGEFPVGHPYEKVPAVPHASMQPPIWLLGSSLYSAELAGLLGLPFAYAHHFSGEHTVAAFSTYRRSFKAGRALDEPYAMVTAQVVVGETDEEAERLALPAGLGFLRLRQGRPGPQPTDAETAAHPWTPLEREFVADRWRNQAVGSSATVRASLADLLERTGADELMITVGAYDLEQRKRTISAVRDMFGEPLPGLQQVGAA